MIVQEIIRYKPASHLVIGTGYDRPSPNTMGKLEYALFLRTMPIQKGDLVVSCFNKNKRPYRVADIYQVIDIDELHRFVVWASPDVGPLCLNLRGCNSTHHTFKGGAAMYVKIEEKDYPIAWKEKLFDERKQA